MKKVILFSLIVSNIVGWGCPSGTRTNHNLNQSPMENVKKILVHGKTTKVNFKDLSKRKGVQNIYTYLNITVVKIEPSELESSYIGKEVEFSRRSKIETDSLIRVGDLLEIELACYDYSDWENGIIQNLKIIK